MMKTKTLSTTATALLVALLSAGSTRYATAFTPSFTSKRGINNVRKSQSTTLRSSEPSTASTSVSLSSPPADETLKKFAETPLDDAVIRIKLTAMERLTELKEKQADPNAPLILRMGVRNGGCSGLSYVMDFSSESEIEEEDQIDEYPDEGIKCVVDAKSMLYLYGLELDYSDDLIGGGFKFFNPNAEDSCGCGSSFGV